MNFIERHRREPLELQLTAMIDIFTMIVIFLVMGTVIGATDVAVPPSAKLPKSTSAESLDAAPQLVFNSQVDANGKSHTVIEIKSLSTELSSIPGVELAEFQKSGGEKSDKVEALKATLKAAIAKFPPERKNAGILLNVVADQATPYKDLFDVIKVFRESGFQSLLFVAAGDRKPLSQVGEGKSQ